MKDMQHFMGTQSVHGPDKKSLRVFLLLATLMCFLTSIPSGVDAKVDAVTCYNGYFHNTTSGACEACHKCRPGTEPQQPCNGLTRVQPKCVRCPSGTYSNKWSYDKCKEHTLCGSWLGRKTIRLGNSLNDTVCHTECLPGYYKPRGIESLCRNCKHNQNSAPCRKWVEDQKATTFSPLGVSNVSLTISNLMSPSDVVGVRDEEEIVPRSRETTSQSLGLVAVVVSVSIVLSVLIVALILCCFCRSGSRRRRPHSSHRGTAAMGHGTNSTHSNRSSSAAGGGGISCCKKTSNDLQDSRSVDQCSFSDYESHHFLCCFGGRFSRCSSLKLREDNQTSNGNYCIKDSSFVFKNGKSLENAVDFQYHQYSVCNEAATLTNAPPYSQSPYSYEPLKKSSSMEMKSKNMIEDLASPLGGVQCLKELPPAPQSGTVVPQPGSQDYAPLPQQQAVKDSATNIGAADDYTNQHLVNNPTADERLTRQNSQKNREKQQQQKLATAQENAYKLRHVSPRRLRSASETIFGTSDGKETILDLLQSREPEEILALKIELISQMYENLKLNELSPDIIKEMTTEMERLPQHVSLNLGRAFIDTYNLTIKAKTVTCAQLLVKTFKHRGAQIEVSQFLQFLHQFGDRKVAESFCDLLISWYRHETLQHKNRLLNSRQHQQQQQMTPTVNHTFQQVQQQQPPSQTVTPLPQRHQIVSPLGGIVGGPNSIYGSGSVGTGAPGVPVPVPHLRTPVLRHSASIPASTTMATTYYQPQPQQTPQALQQQQHQQQHFVPTAQSNKMAAMAAAAANKFVHNNNNASNNNHQQQHLSHHNHTQSPHLMNQAFNGSSTNGQCQQQQPPSCLPPMAMSMSTTAGSTAVNTTSDTTATAHGAAQNMQHLVNYAQMPTLNVHKRPVQEEISSEVGEDDVFD